MPTKFNRRQLLQSAALTAGAVALIRGGLTPTPAQAQGEMPPGTVHSFSKAGVTFHTYVSPPQAVNVTPQVIERGDQLLFVDAPFIPPTAAEVAGLVASTGKPIHTAYISHEHPDHWGGVAAMEGVAFKTLPEVREAVRALEENVLEDIREGDGGAILGWGFAPWSGGPFSWLDIIGAPYAAERCDQLTEQFGARFKTPDLLREMADKGQDFYKRFGTAAKAA